MNGLIYIVAKKSDASYFFAATPEQAKAAIRELSGEAYVQFEGDVEIRVCAFQSIRTSRKMPGGALVYLGTIDEMKQRVRKHCDRLSTLLWRATDRRLYDRRQAEAA